MIPATDRIRHPAVLVTRPAHQASPLIEQIQAMGATAVAFPVLEILPVEDSPRLRQQLAQLPDYDLLIFISTNAVHKAMDWFETTGLWPRQPALAIGQATARALAESPLDVLDLPARAFDSEALLEHPVLQADDIRHKKILVFRGQAGREHLAEQLRQRGAQVDYIQVYRRQKPETSGEELIKYWQQQGMELITVTSNEALQNLYDMLGETGRHLLLATDLIVPGKRCRELATQLGFKGRIIEAGSASDKAIISAILNWQQQHLTST